MLAKTKLTFPYASFELDQEPKPIVIYRPVIPITIFFQSKMVYFAALIDSGADYTLFHSDIAVYLGISLKAATCRQITGISGKLISAYEHKVKLKISSIQYETTVLFSNHLSNNALAALGTHGFFDHFNVHLQFHRKQITLTP